MSELAVIGFKMYLKKVATINFSSTDVFSKDVGETKFVFCFCIFVTMSFGLPRQPRMTPHSLKFSSQYIAPTINTKKIYTLLGLFHISITPYVINCTILCYDRLDQGQNAPLNFEFKQLNN